MRSKSTPPRTVDAPTHRDAIAAVQARANPDKAKFLAGFFKTGKGQYAEGDRFLGVVVPEIRKLARHFRDLPLPEVERLLESHHNEERLLALLILGDQYAKGDASQRDLLHEFYLKRRGRVNNWNLVDSSAPYILGAHLVERERERATLYELMKSGSLWDRRIAVVATLALIRANQFKDTLELTKGLLTDPEDLMHKACGWMLREVGKRDEAVLEAFLEKHCTKMPRTMLRYAIEKFPEAKRIGYLKR